MKLKWTCFFAMISRRNVKKQKKSFARICVPTKVWCHQNLHTKPIGVNVAHGEDKGCWGISNPIQCKQALNYASGNPEKTRGPCAFGAVVMWFWTSWRVCNTLGNNGTPFWGPSAEKATISGHFEEHFNNIQQCENGHELIRLWKKGLVFVAFIN